MRSTPSATRSTGSRRAGATTRRGRGMKRVLACFALAIAALTLVGGVTAKPKKPKKTKPHAKIFDRGCWKGSGSFDYTSEENGATVEFHKGTLTFTLQI